MNKRHLLLSVLLVFTAAVLFVSCGEKGPAGPAGNPGEPVVAMNFQDGVFPTAAYAGTRNARLSYNAPDTNETTYFSAGILNSTSHWRQLIKFDVSALNGTGINVQKAYLTFDVVTVGGTTTITAYALTRDWVEAQATWNSYSTGNLWTTAGGDFGAAASGTMLVTGLGQNTIEINAATVQAWINTPATNYGLLIKASNETTWINRFHASVRTDTPLELRPRLTVYYTAP